MSETTRSRTTLQYLEPILTTSEVAEKGDLICLDTTTGKAVVGQASTTLIPIGVSLENLTGDGVKTLPVRLLREVEATWWDNDGSSPVLASHVGSEAYIKDSTTVSISSASSTRSKAGRVWKVDATRGVLVEAGAAVTGPTGASGTGSSVAVADRAALAAIAAAARADGQLVTVLSDRSFWVFVAASTLTDDEAQELVVAPDAGTGTWIRADKQFTMKVPIAFGLADNAEILTVPEGFVLRLTGLPYWETTVTWAGGTGSKIGINSSVTGATADGAILGGTGGDAPTAGIDAGTVGGGIDTEAELQAFIMVEGDTLKYNEITDAFTAGSGFVCLPVSVNSTAPATP